MANIPLPFRIYIDRLKTVGADGAGEHFEETVPPDFIGVDDADLRFREPVRFSGQAYMAGKSAIVKVSIETAASQPCPVCGEWGTTRIVLGPLTLPVDADQIQGGILDLRGPLREEIILAVPLFSECRPEGCPERSEIERFLKQPKE